MPLSFHVHTVMTHLTDTDRITDVQRCRAVGEIGTIALARPCRTDTRHIVWTRQSVIALNRRWQCDTYERRQ